MGFFRKCVYKKDKKGAWNCVNCDIEKAPHDVGRWKRSCELERRGNHFDKTYLKLAPTKTGISEKVVKATTYFGKDEKVVRTLITTSNRLPQRFYRD